MGQSATHPCGRTMRNICFMDIANLLDKTTLRGIWVNGLPLRPIIMLTVHIQMGDILCRWCQPKAQKFVNAFLCPRLRLKALEQQCTSSTKFLSAF